MKFFNDVKNVKKNWKIVRSSPYASLRLRYMGQKAVIVALILFLAYRFVRIALTMRSGSSIVTWAVNIVLVIALVMIIFKSWATLGPIKAALDQYEGKSQHINYKEMNVPKEIDDIINSLEGEDETKGKDS
jgi:hypothetical protein